MQFLGGAHSISGYNRICDYIASDRSVANSAPAIEKRKTKPQNPESSKNMHTGMTPKLQSVSVNVFFHAAPGTVLFLPDTADKR